MAEQVTNRAFLRFFLPWRVDVIGFVHRCRNWCSRGPRMSHGEARHRTAAFLYPAGTQVFALVLTGQKQHNSRF